MHCASESPFYAKTRLSGGWVAQVSQMWCVLLYNLIKVIQGLRLLKQLLEDQLQRFRCHSGKQGRQLLQTRIALAQTQQQAAAACLQANVAATRLAAAAQNLILARTALDNAKAVAPQPAETGEADPKAAQTLVLELERAATTAEEAAETAAYVAATAKKAAEDAAAAVAAAEASLERTAKLAGQSHRDKTTVRQAVLDGSPWADLAVETETAALRAESAAVRSRFCCVPLQMLPAWLLPILPEKGPRKQHTISQLQGLWLHLQKWRFTRRREQWWQQAQQNWQRVLQQQRQQQQQQQQSQVRVIVFIDDLDRCKPTKIVEVLEAAHMVLANSGFSVVIGMVRQLEGQN